MLRARVRGTLLLVGALLLGTSGCGAEQRVIAEDEPDRATSECREQWADLGEEVEGNQSRPEPSHLAPRWTAVVATVDYYATSAEESDCGEPLAAQKEAITQLEAFSARLAPYDMELRVAAVRDDAMAYAAAPRPPRPAPSPGRKGRKVPQPLPPKPADVSAALTTATQQAPLATQQQEPGWQQARVIEISDNAAVLKTVKDLVFLSTESDAYRKCAEALATIRRALASTGEPPS